MAGILGLRGTRYSYPVHRHSPWYAPMVVAAACVSSDGESRDAQTDARLAVPDAVADVGLDSESNQPDTGPADVGLGMDAQAADTGAGDAGDGDTGAGPSLTCDEPRSLRVLHGGWSRTMSTTSGVPLTFGCGDSTQCPNHMYRFQLDVPRIVRLRLEPAFDGVLGFSHEACAADAEFECVNNRGIGAESRTGPLEAGEHFVSVGGMLETCEGDYALTLAVSTDFATSDAMTHAGPLGGGVRFDSAGDYVEEVVDTMPGSANSIRLYMEIDRDRCGPAIAVFANGVLFGTFDVAAGDGVQQIAQELSDSAISGSPRTTIRVEAMTDCAQGDWGIEPGAQIMAHL